VVQVPGIDGYAAEADRLAVDYERLRSNVTYPVLAGFWPAPPARVCDIGAGTGRDAALFAARGHEVVAVEPTDALRAHGARLHPELTWLDDGLPGLVRLRATGARFDLVYVNAVLMHLDANERPGALASLRHMLAPGGVLFITLRHGPVPAGRRMFAVDAADVIAGLPDLALAYHRDHRDGMGRDAVSWSYLVFRAPA
jgi:SAM-dependent methyltransferase